MWIDVYNLARCSQHGLQNKWILSAHIFDSLQANWSDPVRVSIDSTFGVPIYEYTRCLMPSNKGQAPSRSNWDAVNYLDASPLSEETVQLQKVFLCTCKNIFIVSKYLFPSGYTSGASTNLLPSWTKSSHMHMHMETFSVCTPTNPSKDTQKALSGDKKWSAAERPQRLWSVKYSLFVQDGVERSFSRQSSLLSRMKK